MGFVTLETTHTTSKKEPIPLVKGEAQKKNPFSKFRFPRGAKKNRQHFFFSPPLKFRVQKNRRAKKKAQNPPAKTKRREELRKCETAAHSS